MIFEPARAFPVWYVSPDPSENRGGCGTTDVLLGAIAVLWILNLFGLQRQRGGEGGWS